MNGFEVDVMTELLMSRLRSEGVWKTQKLYSLKSIGFRTLLKYFESVGSYFADDDLIRDYLERQNDIYKGDKKHAWRWHLIRRSAELLVFFAATGRVDMPRMTRWTRRDCLLLIEPSAEQLANNDNIYGLVWRTRNALKEIGYAYRTLLYYDASGFEKILEAHKEAGTEVYSRKICANAVLYAQKLVETGNRYRCQAERKAAALLDEYHRYRTITPAPLSPFNQAALCHEFEALLDDYGNDMLFSGKHSVVTSRTARSIVKGFLFDMEDAGFSTFDGVSLADVGDAIAKTASEHYKRGAESLLHYTKGFLKFLHDYGHTETDLSVAVPKMAAPFKKIYQGFTDDEIRKLLGAVDRSTNIGKRDYAIMVLAVQTGLRAVDIARLKRSDIDWRKREIRVIQSKTDEELCLTLETESGNAVFEYLTGARQDCELANVFIRAVHPLGALNPGAMQGIVQKYMGIAGIEPTKHQRYGFHSFRRAFGTRLLESGTPVHLLSQLLGHVDLDSAMPYMSASEQGLRECCLPLDLGGNGGDAL